MQRACVARAAPFFALLVAWTICVGLNFLRFCQQSIVFDVLNQTLLISVDDAKAIV